MPLDIESLKSRYDRDGYLVVERLLPEALLAELQSQTRRFIEAVLAGHLDGPNLDIFEGERDARHLRRIAHPEAFHDVYDRAMRHAPLLDIVQDLLGGTVRFDHGKLNFKPPAGGAVVEWHQDWAFLPLTNDDMLSVGILLEDCGPENAPLMVVPGSHKGEIFDHHHKGCFVGGIDAGDLAQALPKAVPLTAPAGSITIHHTRTLHGSAVNNGPTNRPLLLFAYAAVDAFPVFHRFEWDEFNSRILRGQPVVVPRMKALPLRIPEPTPKAADGAATRSLFELQQDMDGSLYS